MIERIETLYDLRVHKCLKDFPDDLLRRHARRLAGRPPSAGALIREPVRTIETACFLRYMPNPPASPRPLSPLVATGLRPYGAPS
jgi:hypothetical protein